jgi:hypothetical protein
MKFVKVGRHIVNINQITKIEAFESTGRIEVILCGGGKVELYEPQASAFIETLNASEVSLAAH